MSASSSWASLPGLATTSATVTIRSVVDSPAELALAATRNEAYRRQLWWLIASFIALISIFQFVSWALAKSSSQNSKEKKSDVEAEYSSPRRFSWRNLRTSLVNLYRVVAFRWTFEIGQSYTLNFAEVLVTCAYIIALFTWEFVNTTNLDGLRFDPNYWSNRAGLLASSQFPLIVALGTKNNIVAYITGISYDKLNYVHRMIARVNFVLLWVHGGTKLHLQATLPNGFAPWYIQLGMTTLFAYTLLIVVSLRPIRSRVYEVFYFTHFLMVLTILIAGYYHANTFKEGAYIWPALVVWGADRVLRGARVVYYNHLYFGSRTRARQLDASVELLSPQFLRVRVHRPPHFNWTPGQTAFLIMPTVSKFPLEAHPFSIASVDSRYKLSGTRGRRSQDTTALKESSHTLDIAPYWNEVVFFIQVREGFTKRLGDAARKGEKVPVLLDGPYGFSPNLDDDNTVILIAGGSGISFALSTFLGVVSHVQQQKSQCKRLVLVWSIRDAGYIDWVSEALMEALELAPPQIEISLRFFVTSRNTEQRVGTTALAEVRSCGDDDSVHSSDRTMIGGRTQLTLLDCPPVQVSQGRPDLTAILQQEVASNSGRMSVTVCGSQAVARACRKALRIPLSTFLNGGPSVELHVESFGYA